MIDNKAEKYYSESQYTYALNNPIKFLDPDGNDVVLNYLTSDAHKAAFNKFMSTTEGRAFVSQYMKAGTYNLNGITYTFKSDGARAKDNLYFRTANKVESVSMDASVESGQTDTYTKDMSTDLREATKKTDVSGGVAEIISLNDHMTDVDESTVVMSHEAFVHAQSDASKLNAIDKKDYKGNTIQKVKDLQSVGEGTGDHSKFKKNGNTAYEKTTLELDKKDKTTYYHDYYTKDKKDPFGR